MTHQGTRATPTGSATTSVPAFVGRERELTSIVDALAIPPALVLVEGEAGIGKTRLLREALASPALAESKVLVVACPPVAEPFPLGPVISGVTRLRPDVARVGLSPLGGALRPLFPEWAGQLPPAVEALEDPKETRYRIFRALTELIEKLGVDILVVEDAHWADTATLEWLLTLVTAEPMRCTIMVSYRPTDVPDGSLLPRLTSRAPAGVRHVRVELAPLDIGTTRELVASMFGTEEVSEKFAEFLHDRADGVPLAVEECVRLLRDREDIVLRHGQWTRRILDEVEVPPTVRDSVLERVERLDPDVRAVLEAAAVLAAPADEQLLTTVAGLDGTAGQAAVAGALASGLLQETGPGRFVFRHVLDSQAVGEAIPASLSRHFHARAAEALQRVEPEPVVRLARHHKEAGDTEAWCHHAEAAADLALESGDDHTAVVTLLDLLDAIEHPVERRLRLVRKLGEAAFFGAAALGDLAHQVVDVLRRVLDVGGLPQGERGELRLLLGRMVWDVGEPLAAFEEMEAAVPDLGHRADLAIRAMSNLALPLVPNWPAERHLYWLERAGELVDQVAPMDRQAFNRNRALVLLLLGEDAGWPACRDISRFASTAVEQRVLAGGLLNTALAMLAWGRYDDVRRQLTEAVDLIQLIDHQRLAISARQAGAFLDWYTGAWDGLEVTVSILAEAEQTERVDRLHARQILGLLELVAGARASARKRLRDVVDEYARLGVVRSEAVLGSAALGRLHLADGAAEKALQVTEPVMAMIARKKMWLWTSDVAPVHVDALIATGRLSQAETVANQFAVWLEGRNAAAPAAALVACQAALAEAKGELSEAVNLFADAASAWACLPQPYDELLASERRGRCLLAVGQQDVALELLVEVKERLNELGARWDSDRVSQLLRQHGVDVTRAWRRGPRGYGDQLSPREKEVLALIAQGMTNREAGEVLFLSHRTVGRHLSAAMRKLGVTTRTGAAMAATEAGLIATDSDISTS